ncbi:MAG TPA: phosphonatase-like hydrolase [Pyrinomonadaceae bacterium]|jgi:phosphonatase-like hydrolase|nr:phosphonatase-like hydrolase [Pyrinomonadaceae bacterium]
MDEVKLVVFDLAGTTVRDRGQVTDAFTAALASHDIAVTPEQLSEVRGSSKREAVLRFIPEGPQRERRAELVYDSFRQHLMHSYGSDGVEPVDGAEEIFRWLRTRGVRVALNTGFDRDITELLLTALNWKAGVLVDAVVCGDEVREGRPAPYLIFRAMELTGTTAVQHVANVGDTVLDLEAGNNAGVRWNVGVLSGAHDRQILERAPHTHILSSITELTDIGFIK